MLKSVFIAVIAILSFAMCVVTACAQDVTFSAHDGSISVNGSFLSFDGEFYRVETDLGVLTLDQSGVVCEGPGCPSLGPYIAKIRLSGEPQIVNGLLPAMISAFARRSGYTAVAVGSGDANIIQLHDKSDQVVAEFHLSATSSSQGFTDLFAEKSDVVVSMRKLSKSELSVAKQSGVGDLRDPLRARVVALDALVPIVSRSNTVNAVSLSVLKNIFVGNVKNWQDLGGRDAPIALHLHGDDMSKESQFFAMVFATNEAELAPSVQIHKDYKDLASAVNSDPYAIGIGRMSVSQNVMSLALTGECGFATTATLQDVKTEDYPITQPVFLYTPARRLPKVARDFLNFAISPAAQLVVSRSNFVDQSVDEMPFQVQGQRFANAILRAGDEIGLDEIQSVARKLHGAKRLSLGFRFEDGSTSLDAQSRSNALHFAELLEAGVYDGKTLLFAGFSDGTGTAQINERLSKKRANSVLTGILKSVGDTFDRSRVTLNVSGFGEAMPLACDDVEWGRKLNRRVEIWIRD